MEVHAHENEYTKNNLEKQAPQIFTVFSDRLCLCIYIPPNEKLSNGGR